MTEKLTKWMVFSSPLSPFSLFPFSFIRYLLEILGGFTTLQLVKLIMLGMLVKLVLMEMQGMLIMMLV